MNKLEEAANTFADEHGFRVPYNVSGREITNDDYYDKVDIKASKDGFLAGAEWQKSNMWNSVEEALPSNEDTKVICMMKSNGELVSGYIYLNNGVPTIETNPAFEFEDYSNYEVTHWMPIPEIKEGE